jgi:LysM domain
MSTATELVPRIRVPERTRSRPPSAVVLAFPSAREQRTSVAETPARPVAAAVPVGETRPEIRLTRRGRAAAVLTVLTTLAGALWLAHSSAAESSAPHRSPPATVIVGPDDTLWSVATRIAPDQDPRVVVSELERRNNLAGPTVHAGQVLRAR